MTFFPIIITLAAAALALSVARVFSQPLKLLDRPSSRKQHVGAVPLVGGIAIFVGGWSGLWVVSGQIDGLWPLWIASLLIFLVGLQDDRVNLSVKPRFLVEVVAVSLLVFAANVSLTNLGDLFGFGEIELGWFAFPFTLIAVVGVINALNMVDGVDGLAGTLSIITLAAMGVMAWSAGRVAEGWVALLFILATLPYLFCNLGICGFERRVFLGDAGSMLLGFVIAWLAVTLSHPSHLGEPAVFAPVTALWLFAIPLMDTVAIMVRRLLKGQSPFLPDRDHLHHIVMRAGYRDRHALLMISLSAVIMVGVGLWMEFIAVDESIRFAWFIGLAAIYMFMLQHVWRLIRLIKAFRQQINHSLWLLLNPLTGLSRPVKQFVLLVLDGLLIYAALIAALLLRFGEWHVVSIYFGGPLSFGVWGAPLLAYPIFSWFGLYRSIIRFFGSQALWAVTGSVMLYGMLYMGSWKIVAISGFTAHSALLPNSVLVLHLLLLLLVVGGSRMVARHLLSLSNEEGGRVRLEQKVVVVGVGKTGRQLASGLKLSARYQLSGFVDLHGQHQGRVMLGVPVIALNEMDNYFKRKQVTDVLLADEQLEQAGEQLQREHLLQQLRGLQVRVRAIPDLDALVQGKADWQDLKELSVVDLLQRPSIQKEFSRVSEHLKGKTVVVLGAGGRVGSELSQQILALEPKVLLLYEQNEESLQRLYNRLTRRLRSLERGWQDQQRSVRLIPRIVPLLGGIQDGQRLGEMLKTWRPQWLFHAAAHKQVEMLEHNITEGIKNNVLATLTVARVAVEQQVEQVVLLSEESVSKPTSAMDCTKRLSEMVFQAVMAESSPVFEVMGEPSNTLQRETVFTVLRFGRLIHSELEVVKKIRKQIYSGGPVTISADANQYVMTLPEAVGLLLLAVVGRNEVQPEELFLLNPERPIQLVKLAERMVELSGRQVKRDENALGDIEIIVEENENKRSTREGETVERRAERIDPVGIFRLIEQFKPWNELQAELMTLQLAAENGDVELVSALLQKLVDGYKPEKQVRDYIFREQVSKR